MTITIKAAGPSSAEERRYRAEDALRTLEAAEKIRTDAKLMAEVAKCRDEKVDALKRIRVQARSPK